MKAIMVYYGDGAAPVKALNCDAVFRTMGDPTVPSTYTAPVPGVANITQGAFTLCDPTTLPNLTATLADLNLAAQQGAFGVVLCHEIGIDHPKAAEWLDLVGAEARRLKMEPYVIVGNIQAATIARAAGCSLLSEIADSREIPNAAYTNPEDAVANAAKCLAISPVSDKDFVIVYAVGQKNFDFNDKWSIQTVSPWHLARTLAAVKSAGIKNTMFFRWGEAGNNNDFVDDLSAHMLPSNGQQVASY